MRLLRALLLLVLLGALGAGVVAETPLLFAGSGAPVVDRVSGYAVGVGTDPEFALPGGDTLVRLVTNALAPFNTVRYVPPAGAFYAFFGIEGMSDSLAAALQMVDEANIGLAPGTAFGDGGAPYFRVCFLRAPAQVSEAMRRLAAWLDKRQSQA